MAFLSSMNIIGSGLTAEQLRLDVVSENITNMAVGRLPASKDSKDPPVSQDPKDSTTKT